MGTQTSDPHRPRRWPTAVSTLLLVGLGAFFVQVLVFDSNDNAYLWVLLNGYLLILASVPFALATLLPYGAIRKIVGYLAIALLLIVGAFSLFLLISGIFISLGQGDGDVFLAHLLALLALLPVLFFISFRFNR